MGSWGGSGRGRGDRRGTVSEEETGCGFAFLVEEVDDLKHKFNHELRSGHNVSASYITVETFSMLSCEVLIGTSQNGGLAVEVQHHFLGIAVSYPMGSGSI